MTQADLDKHLTSESFPPRLGLPVVLLVFFFMREMECATAEFVDLRIDDIAMVIYMSMPVSKNDPRALGCERKWGGVCLGAPSPRTCPYHAAVELVSFLKARFGKRVYADGFPLLLGHHGEPVSAKVMLDMIIATDVLLGEPLLNKAGQNRIGKHTWRAMAAVMLGEAGVDVNKSEWLEGGIAV